MGTMRLAVSLPSRATFVAVSNGRPGWASIEPDGSIRTKVGWFSPSGRPQVMGRLLGGGGRPLNARVGVESFVPSGYRFYPSTITFPSVGCWRITATNRTAHLQFVVRVVEQ
jgi:hypothetical protein